MNSRSVRWGPASTRSLEPNNNQYANPNSFEETGTTFYDSSPMISRSGSPSGRPRKSKMQKIKELLDENRQLKDTAFRLQQELNEKELQMKKSQYSQAISGQGTEEGKPHDKHIEALRALTAVTKTQQESLALHHERHEGLRRAAEEHEHESIRLRKELHKKKKEILMLEKEIDSNLLEITGLRKDLKQALQQSEVAENEIRTDRRKVLELSRELALVKSGYGASKDVAHDVNAFDEEMRKKDEEIEAQRIELEKQAALAQRLQEELESTQDQVEQYERERDATVADMETYYEALKHELEEKNRLLEEAEREKEEMDTETTAALRALEDRCDQLNAEILDAHDEISFLRRENDASNFDSMRSESAQQDTEEEKLRLNKNLEAMSAELNSLKQLREEMKEEHAEAIESLERENGELIDQQEEFRAALREANTRNREISEKIELMKVENESLMEVSRDLKMKLNKAEEEASNETTPVVQDAPKEGGGDQSTKGVEPPAGGDPNSSISNFPVNVVSVSEDNGSQSSDSVDAEKGNVGSSADSGDGEAVTMDPPETSRDPPDSTDAAGQQALLLAAAAGRQTPKSQLEKPPASSWRSMSLRKRTKSPLPPAGGSVGRNSPFLETDGQVEDLAKINKEQKETIARLQSEMVRINAYYRDAAYVSKRKIETLTQENAAYEIKIAVLEKMLEKIGDPTGTHSSAGSVGGHSITADDDEEAPQRDWSSPPKYLDQIKELEEKVATLESQKSFAEAKMKAVEMDLEGHQRTAKQAARDSLFTIERLKRENAELDRRLSLLEKEKPDADSDDCEPVSPSENGEQ